MQVQLSKTRKILFVVTLLLASCIGMGDFIVIPIMNDWFVAYGDQMGLVNYAMSGSLIGMIIGSLLAGVLARLMSKKLILLIAAAVFTISGFCTMFASSIMVVCVLRTITGITFGFIMVAPYPLINQVFEDEASRSKIVGFFAASQSGWGILIGIIAGAIAVAASDAVYYLYLFGIVLVVMILMFVPDTGREGKSDEGAADGFAAASLPLMSIAAICIAVAFAALTANATSYEVSILVDQLGIGDALLAGTLGSVYMASSFVFNLFFGAIYNKLKRFTSVICYGALAIGVTLIWINPSTVLYYVAFALVGLGWGSLLAYYPMHFSVIVPANKQSSVLSIFNAIQAIGGFACTYVVTGVIAAQGSEQVVDAFPLLSAIMAAAVVLTVVLGIRFNRTHDDEQIVDEAVSVEG